MSIYRRLTGGVVAVAVALPVSLVMPVAGLAQVEEITVTTRKREESLQEVPLAVTAIGAEQIERLGITGLGDVVDQDPSVQFDTAFGPADTRITIRGLSNTRGRSNVAFLIDGIDVTTENLNAAGSGLLANRRLLSDVERIEVVKGPQSALYGRAAFSGAINYVTKSPGDEFEGKVGWDIGDFGTRQVDFAAGGPLIDGLLGLRVSGVWYESDGYYTNSISGEPLGDVDGHGVAVTLLYTPTDELRIKVRGEHSREDSGPLPNARIGGGTSGKNMRLFEYPAQALAAGLGQNVQFFDPASTSTSTALINFGQYCPDSLKDPSRGPGYCLPTHMGNANGLVVAHGEDPLTGEDYSGTKLETDRLSIETTLDTGLGTFSAFTGFIDFEGFDAYDQDWQAVGRPDTLLGTQSSRSTTKTRQFSQELRFRTELDGPLQLTGGILYWHETRRLADEAVILFCTLTRRTSESDPTLIQDARDFCNGQGGTLDNLGAYYRQLQPQIAGPWHAETESWSFYGVAEWDIADDWQLIAETRFISENFNFSKPNQSSCTNFFGPNPGQQQMVEEIVVGGVVTNDQVCSTFFAFTPDFDLLPIPPSLTGQQGYRVNRGRLSSHFSTPKLTLRWTPDDTKQFYFSWSRAQKPGGIATTPAGGSPTSINDDRFDSEKMTAWELGAKTDWAFMGFLRVNAAGFFQDYSDKQVGTQVLQDGFLAPRVVNASSAEVWGFEVEAIWQPDFVEGLTISTAWTHLDAFYGDYKDDVTAMQRIAQASDPCAIVYKGGAGPNPNDLSDPANGSPFCRFDFSDNRLERTPRNAITTSFNYTQPFLDTPYEWFVELASTYQDKRYLEADNSLFFDSYYNFDTRIGLIGERFDILAYVDNIFEDDTIKTGGTGPDFGNQVVELGFVAGLGVSHVFATLPAPRVFGVRANYRFGAGR